MIKIVNGKYNEAKVFTDNVEKEALKQIEELCDQEFCIGSKIRIMPDTHAGAGCTIGTTMTILDKIVPNLVGVDIGCGMLVTVLKETEIDFSRLDAVIREFVPSGFNTRQNPHELISRINLGELRCKDHINLERAIISLGTLGGGNHFIEVDVDEFGCLYLVIHSGSRNLGKQTAEYYQKIAIKKLKDNSADIKILIEKLRFEGRQSEIQQELKRIKAPKINETLAYVYGQDFDDYIHDMKIIQEYATYNRIAMAREIMDHMGLTVHDQYTTIHNYIDADNMVLRKGAISARKGEKVIIPINMRDGSLICIGKGNPDWNYSAPHGAGRIMSRSKAKQKITLEEFQNSMNGIWSSSVSVDTIDESPMVYKPMEEIVNNIGDTVYIESIIKPLYNFKASE